MKMTYQKCPVLLMCRDSISKGFFRTPVRQAPRPNCGGRRSRPRSRSTDSPARIVEALGKQFLRPSHFSTLVYGTRGCWLAPCPGFAAPPTTPLLWSSRLVLGEVDAHFLEIGEVLIVSPSLIALEIRLSSMSTHGRLVFPLRDRGIVIYVAEARRVRRQAAPVFKARTSG